MSTFHARAFSKALREALDTITSDPLWSKITQPTETALPNGPNGRRTLFYKAPPPPPPRPRHHVSKQDARKTFEEQHRNCAEVIATIDAYAAAWGPFEMPDFPRHILKEGLVIALDDITQQNNEVMFELRRDLRSRQQTYGKVISVHEVTSDWNNCVLSFDLGVVVVDRGKRYCFHHPFNGLYRDKDMSHDESLLIIRYATSIARLLLVVFQ